MSTLKYLLLAPLIAGCAGTISSNPPPADWPELKVSVISLPASEMLDTCTQNGVLLSETACALISFSFKTCTIVGRDDRPMSPFIERHERDHCRGKDHVGEDTLRRAWEKWKTR